MPAAPPPPPDDPAGGAEAFHAGWVQLGRERGEQIMLLGWRLPDRWFEALVFLLDWHGDGLKDFYVTRELDQAEWERLVEHNRAKGIALTEIDLAEGRALLEAALAEGRRFSRPLPREYRLAQGLVRRRILDATPLPPTPRAYVSPDLDPAEVVRAYVRALHHRDYLLAWELLAPDHPQRAAGPHEEARQALRRALKQAPRRAAEVEVSPVAQGGSSAGGRGGAGATLLALGAEERTEPGGRRAPRPVRERYRLRRTPEGWRIAAVEAVAAE